MLSLEASSMVVKKKFQFFFFNGFERLRIFIEEKGGIDYQPQLEERKNGYKVDQWLVFSDVDAVLQSDWDHDFQNAVWSSTPSDWETDLKV